MNALGMSVADWIGQVRRTLAVGSVLRHRERVPDALRSFVDPLGGDAESVAASLLDHLGEALAAGRAELFENHVRWLETVFRGHDADVSHVRLALDALRDELAASLPEDARALAIAGVERGLAVLDPHAPAPTSHLPDGAPLVDIARRYLLAILEGRPTDALRTVLDEADRGTPVDDLLTHVVLATQRELGRMWQVGDVHTAEEHFASRIAERLTDALHDRIAPAPRLGRRVLVASVGGNAHDLGARFVADRFERAGWDALLLGANTPPRDLARAIDDFGADLVALSTATTLDVRSTARTIATLRGATAPRHVPVLVGGGPFLTVPELWRDVGADGTATDAQSALTVAGRLVDAG